MLSIDVDTLHATWHDCHMTTGQEEHVALGKPVPETRRPLSYRLSPLLSFFLRTRFTAVQWTLAGLYTFSTIYTSVRSGPVFESARFWIVMMFLWPLWLADDAFATRGAIRLFVTPRASLVRVVLAYLLARNAFALILGVFVFAVAMNIRVFSTPVSAVGTTLVYCVGSALVIVNVINLWAMLARGKMVIVLTYANVFLLMKVIDDLGSTVGIQLCWMLPPVWILVAGGLGVDPPPVHFLQIVTSSFVWIGVALWAFVKRYR